MAIATNFSQGLLWQIDPGRNRSDQMYFSWAVGYAENGKDNFESEKNLFVVAFKLVVRTACVSITSSLTTGKGIRRSYLPFDLDTTG